MLLLLYSLAYNTTQEPIYVRALVLNNGSLKQISDAELGFKTALVIFNGAISEQIPLVGKALVYDNGIIREILSTETLIYQEPS